MGVDHSLTRLLVMERFPVLVDGYEVGSASTSPYPHLHALGHSLDGTHGNLNNPATCLGSPPGARALVHK